MVIFKTLDREAVKQVVALELSKLQKRLKEKLISFNLTEEAKSFLATKGYQPEMGARPIRRTIEEYVEDALAEKLLQNPSPNKREFDIALDDNKLTFTEKLSEGNEEKKEVLALEKDS